MTCAETSAEDLNACPPCCCEACTEKDVHGCACCACVPRRLCALLLLTDGYEDYCADCAQTFRITLDEDLFEATGVIEYATRIGCNGEGHDLVVTAERNYDGDCVWRVVIESLYIDEEVLIRGDYGIRCDMSMIPTGNDYPIEFPVTIGGCDLILAILPESDWIKLKPRKPTGETCLIPWCLIGGNEALVPVPCRCICPSLCVTWIADDAYVQTNDICGGVIPWDGAADTSSQIVWEGAFECTRYTTTLTLKRTLFVRVTLYRDPDTNQCLVDVYVEDQTVGGEFEGIIWENVGWEPTACLNDTNGWSLPLPDYEGLFVGGPTLTVVCATCGTCPPQLINNPCCVDEFGDPVNWPTSVTLAIADTGGCSNLDGLSTTLLLDECTSFPEIGPSYFGTITVSPSCRISFCLFCDGGQGSGVENMRLRISTQDPSDCCDEPRWSVVGAAPDPEYANSCEPIDLKYGDQGITGCCLPIPELGSFSVFITA